MGERWKILVGSGCGVGYIPILPGSFGALWGVLFHWIAVKTLPDPWMRVALFAGLLLVAWANHVLTPWAQAHYGSKDPGRFILDEIAGYLVTALFFPPEHFALCATWGFALFRILDMIKLPGARWFDKKATGAWGILLDDVVSGVYAAIAVWLVWRYAHWLGVSTWLPGRV